jgi:hypothetical protein
MRSCAFHHLQCYLFPAFEGAGIRVHFTTYNVTSLRPPGELALLEHSMGQLVCEVLVLTNLAFCGIHEHHWLGSNELKAKGYFFLYFGHRNLVRKGMTFALSPNIASSLLAWLAMSPHLMWVQL